VSDDGQALAIDVLAVADRFDGRPRIFREMLQSRRFRPAAALSNAALVVPQDEEAGIGKDVGDLAEDRNAGNVLVAIDGIGAADEDHRGQLARRVRRLGDGAGQ
jgi:hypothetical protein